MRWFEGLRRASFGGVPFGVYGGDIRVGRRNAVHEYPFKDEVWVEDLGRAARRVTLLGFLVENGVYGGGPVISQREQMIAACESAGKSTLVHPTLGTLQVSLLSSAFRERWDQGRVFEVAFEFVEAGDRVFPSSDPATQDLVGQMCTAADAAGAADFASNVLPTLAGGEAVIGMAVSTSGGWISEALSLAGDATNLMNTVASLPGSFGRFFGTGLRGFVGSVDGLSAVATTIQGLIALGTSARAAVSTACTALSSAAASLGVGSASSFGAVAQAIPAAMLTATTDPGDSMRVLTSLAAFTPAAPTPASDVGTSMATMQRSCGDLFRRAAVVSVCRASAKYQPFSYDDATAVRSRVTTLLDAEIQIAGNQGEDATYTALRAVRTAVVKNLAARGASLAPLTTIATPRPVPALTLAQRVYRDAARADEMIVESNCVHPAFMPTSFRGLAQ